MKIKILFLISCSLKISFLFSQINLSQGLIAYYPFNGNAFDVSGNNFNAVNFGATLTTDARNVGNKAYEFNGTSSYIILPSSPKFNFLPTDSFSISCWIQPYNNSLSNLQALVVKSGFDVNPQNATWSYGLYIAMNKAMSGFTNNSFLNSSTTFQLSKCWYHLVVTYKNGIWYLYVNGKIEAQDVSQTKFITANGSVTSVIALGRKGSTFGDFYKGKLDEVKIYNRNLNKDEVDALYRLDNLASNFSFVQSTCNPLEINFKNETTNFTKLYWNFDSGWIDSLNNTVQVNYNNFNTYNVQLVTLNSFGCFDTIVKKITLSSLFDSSILYNQKDTSICIGKSLQLNLSDTGNGYCWSSSNNRLLGSSFNPIVTPTSNTKYTITTNSLGNNLVVNGDFEQGNTGFQTDYTYHSGTAGGIQTIYTIANNPNVWLSAFAACSDHTIGIGNDKMMMLDGSTTINKDLWRQTIVVKPNTNYIFSFYLQSIVNQFPAIIRAKVNGKIVGSSLTADNTTCTWKKFTAQFNTENLTTISVALEDLNTQSNGNDFAIDDISLNEIIFKQDTINVKINKPTYDSIIKTICFGDSVNGYKATGIYKNTYTNSVGCDSINVLNLKVLPVPITTLDTLKGCDSVVFNAITYTKNQIVTTKILNQFGCDSIINNHQIIINAAPTNTNLLSNDTSICQGDKIFLYPGKYKSYLWSTNSLDTAINIQNLGQYWVKVTDSLNCIITDTFNLLNVFATPKNFITPNITTTCLGNSFTLNGFNSYQWNTGVQTPAIVLNGLFKYWVTVTNSDGCSGLDTIFVKYNTPSYDSTNKTICFGDSVNGHKTSGIYKNTFTNSLGCDSMNVLNLTVLPAPITKLDSIKGCISVQINGIIYTTNQIVTEIKKNLFGCDSVILQHQIIILPATNNNKLLRQDTSICEGDKVILYPGKFKKYLWNTGSIDTAINVQNIGRYWVKVTDSVNCNSVDTFNLIDVYSKPKGFILDKNPTVCFGQNFPLNGYKNYQWNTGETTSSIKLIGLNKYWVIVTNNNNCQGRDSFYVTYSSSLIPNNTTAFSPNGDGINEEFKPYDNSSCFKSYRLVIFDRFGNKLFETINANNGWKGTSNNGLVPVGVYYYILNFETVTGIKEVKNGYVTLLR